MDMCENPECGKRLMPIRRLDGSMSTRHPTPKCDPDSPDWPDLTPEPVPAPQEATLT